MSERINQSESHSVIFALVRDGKILVEERLEVGKWKGLVIIPGGHIEDGETQEDAMFREVRDEELGVIPLKFKRLGSVTTSGDDLVLKVKHVFLIEDWEGEIVNVEQRNKQLYLTLEEAKLTCTHPISQMALEMVIQELSRQD